MSRLKCEPGSTVVFNCGAYEGASGLVLSVPRRGWRRVQLDKKWVRFCGAIIEVHVIYMREKE